MKSHLRPDVGLKLEVKLNSSCFNNKRVRVVGGQVKNETLRRAEPELISGK